MRKKISIVIPVYNEEANIAPLLEEVRRIKDKRHDYEIIFVDDGSIDKTLNMVEAIALKNKEVKYISFSRNFGHQIALKAGLDHATGDCVITMDGDLQHPPRYIMSMIRKWEEGYDVVYSIRSDKEAHTSFFKKITSNAFYRLLNSISDIKVPPGGADFRLLDRKIVALIKEINEPSFFLRGIIPWFGFNQTSITYKVDKRYAGEPKYSFKKMLLFALDGITSSSIKPLRIATFIGFFLAFISSLYGVYAIMIQVVYKIGIPGWASIVTAIVFMGGFQLMILGIIGEYLGKLFMESKRRPLYIVKKIKMHE